MPWVKGQSGNPGGRPRLMAGARRKAQGKAESALDYIAKAATGEIKKINPLRMQACINILRLAGASFAAEVHDDMEDAAAKRNAAAASSTPDLETAAGGPELPLN